MRLKSPWKLVQYKKVTCFHVENLIVFLTLWKTKNVNLSNFQFQKGIFKVPLTKKLTLKGNIL